MRYVVCGKANQLLILCTGILAESQDRGRIAEGLVQSSQGPLCQGCRHSEAGFLKTQPERERKGSVFVVAVVSQRH